VFDMDAVWLQTLQHVGTTRLDSEHHADSPRVKNKLNPWTPVVKARQG
jgi:hypothetical protein